MFGANEQPADAGPTDPLAAIRSLSALADSYALLALPNFHRYLNSTEILQAVAHQIIAGKQNRTFIGLARVVQTLLSSISNLRCWNPRFRSRAAERDHTRH